MEFATGDQLCDSCMHTQVMCMWPTTGSLWQVCFGCQQLHGKCEIVMSRALGYPTRRLGLVVLESRGVWMEASARALRQPSVTVQVF